ncbi:DUF3806 domain-containing protein [Comamonas thiooxydans]|uniref:DUF3806 domain-containing protein n=1 Tax=Comamonas thiooxydans TaxID=363952 RepID=UPI00050F47BB|nr:DUF3806 domain-containing protein [Comamonas thiooxydans]KGG89070.1 hypothetical protein P609_05040 [Comamonas thiooxydans]
MADTSYSPEAAAQADMPVFRALAAQELEQLERERLLVCQVAARELGLSDWSMDRSGLAQLQPLLDRGLVSADNLLLARGLGVVLGDALSCEMDDMDWHMVSDDWGTDPVVRYRETSIQVGARDMVLKRLEDGQSVDLLHLLDGVISHLQPMIDSGDYQ